MRLRDDGVVVREIDGETVLLDLVSSTYFASNQTGTFLLRLLRSERDRASLIAELAWEFKLGVDQATDDTDAFLAALEQQGLLVRASPT